MAQAPTPAGTTPAGTTAGGTHSGAIVPARGKRARGPRTGKKGTGAGQPKGKLPKCSPEQMYQQGLALATHVSSLGGRETADQAPPSPPKDAFNRTERATSVSRIKALAKPEAAPVVAALKVNLGAYAQHQLVHANGYTAYELLQGLLVVVRSGRLVAAKARKLARSLAVAAARELLQGSALDEKTRWQVRLLLEQADLLIAQAAAGQQAGKAKSQSLVTEFSAATEEVQAHSQVVSAMAAVRRGQPLSWADMVAAADTYDQIAEDNESESDRRQQQRTS